MKKIKYFLFGFLGFLVVTGFNVSVAVVFYSKIEYKENYQIALLMIVVIVINALLCSIIDVFRRKIMIEKPLNEILKATKSMARGNFKVRLIPSHSYQNYDEFDLIKDDLNRMAEELSKSEILKNDFVANVSHEIKTPLAVIINYVKVLNTAKLTQDERSKYLKNLEDACHKINNLVTNILKLNKLENQRLVPELSRFNLSNLLVDEILQFEDLLSEKRIELECDIEEDLYICSESSYLQIIFNNLISNAMKFTKTKIYISLNKKEEEYIIIVKDDGCGMDGETGKHIFDKFYQADTSHSKEGNGLGLALVKKVIDILGGTISVTSELNKGTTFKIIIKE